MATKRDEQAADYRAEAIASPFAEAAERSSPVSKMGQGQSGMRVERVTLEFEIERGSPPSEWPWSYILSRSDALKMRPGESVRVVKEAHFDDLATVAMERDAAIRERDAAKARVAQLEAASGGGKGEAVPISPAERDGLQVIVDGVVRHGNGFVVIPGSDSLRAVESLLARHTTSPPQPRGWLSEDERGSIQHAATCAKSIWSYSLAQELENILARSSPPEVVLESWREAAGEVVSLDDVRAALAAIGVAVKEVGRD